jgi:hypothetical protein
LRKSSILLAFLALPGFAALSVWAARANGAEPLKIEAGPFSHSRERLPEGWEPLLFPKISRHTTYSLVDDGEGVTVVRADSRASASGLVRSLEVDLRKTPIVRWRWRVEGVLEKGNVHRKEGDDYPARLYVTFRYQPERVSGWRKLKYLTARAFYGDIPIAGINYIWANRAELGQVIGNPYASSYVKMIVIESGSPHVGSWREEERNLYVDYLAAFGEEPPLVQAVAIMTDTDNTGESAVAYYGDIAFEAEPETSVIEAVP